MSVLTQKQAQQIHHNMGQFLSIEQANLLEMSQGELASLIKEIEHSNLFIRLFKEDKIICYNRVNRADVSKKFYTFDGDAIPDSQSPDVETLLLNKKRIIEYIQDIGPEKFKKFFLLPEDGLSSEEVAKNCNIEIPQVKAINDLVDDIEIMSELYHTSKLNSNGINYTKIASIERAKDGFTIGYFSRAIAKGRYVINYELFEGLASSERLDTEEVRMAKALFKKLEMINRCKETLHQVLDKIITKQVAYLDSGNTKDILPLSQKELAAKIGIVPSTISRAIKYRTIETPQGKEVTLKSFFPRPKNFKMMLLKKVLETETGLSSDSMIQRKLAEKYGVNISRRSVANLRNELNISPKSSTGR